MPYKVKCKTGCKGACCKVHKKGTKKTYSKKLMTKTKAKRQMRLLYSLDK